MNRLSDEWFSSKSESVPLWHKIALSIDEMYVYTGTVSYTHLAREGTPITLIDGNDLIRLVIKYELYITPVTTYVLDGFYTED